MHNYSRENVVESSAVEPEPVRTESLKETLLDLHDHIYPRLRSLNIDLYPEEFAPSYVTDVSAACLQGTPTATLTYFRSTDQAQLIERLMGIEAAAKPEPHRHPVVELRFTENHFAVELVISPLAWWDQQNLTGKLSLSQHRHTFRTLLKELDNDLTFGFWDGLGRSDMHLLTWQLLNGSIFDEWMATFADGCDFMRVGKWYEVDTNDITADDLVEASVEQIKGLYQLYEFALWTSDNNYREFSDSRR